MSYEALATQRSRSRGAPGRALSKLQDTAFTSTARNEDRRRVIDNGLGDASDVWSELHPKFADLTRTCVYDRAGLGRRQER
jgi:hypothetical protein